MKTAATLVSALLYSTISALAKVDHHHIAHAVEKRGQGQYSGQATWFVDGLGACGKVNGPNDFIVALNTPQYGSGSPGPQCFKSITIYAGGKSAVATIMDECPTCDYGSLDMSHGLFLHFNPISVGEFPITWSYNDGSGGGGGGDDDKPTTTKEKPHTTTHHTTTTHTTPTSTYVPPTTTKRTSTTHTTHSTTSTTKTTSKTTPTSTSTTSSAAPTTSVAAAGNLELMAQVINDMAVMLDVAAGGN